MEQNIKVTNKIITIDTIKKFANYLQDIYRKYDKLIINDKEKNELLDYKERNYEYYGSAPKLEYTIETLDGKSITQTEYGWFENFIEDPKIIKFIQIQLRIYFSTQMGNDMFESLSKHLTIRGDFYEDRINIYVDGKELESEVHTIYSDLRSILEDSENRFDKTIKRRSIRMQSFYFSIGMIFSYIAVFIMLLNIDKMPEQIIPLINNKYVIVGVHTAISIIIGNIFGSLIMNKLYENIIPERKYSHYNQSSGKMVYVDNIADYTEKNEIQIGKFYNSLERRKKIEKIYRISRLVVLCQIAVYGLYVLIIK